LRSQRRKKKKRFISEKSGNVLRKGNYSVFGLKEKELGCEIKWVKKNGSIFPRLVQKFWRGGEIFNLKCLVQFLEWEEGRGANFIALSKLSLY